MANYGLFKRIIVGGKVRYERKSTEAFPKSTAVRIWQDRLIFEGLCLRPVKDERSHTAKSKDIEAECPNCAAHLHTQCSRGTCTCACRRHQRA